MSSRITGDELKLTGDFEMFRRNHTGELGTYNIFISFIHFSLGIISWQIFPPGKPRVGHRVDLTGTGQLDRVYFSWIFSWIFTERSLRVCILFRGANHSKISVRDSRDSYRDSRDSSWDSRDSQ